MILNDGDSDHVCDVTDNSIIDCKSNNSQLVNGRRSRKERSTLRHSKSKGLTQKMNSNLIGKQLDKQMSNLTQKIAPQVRMIPGSETISLELDIKGM